MNIQSANRNRSEDPNLSLKDLAGKFDIPAETLSMWITEGRVDLGNDAAASPAEHRFSPAEVEQLQSYINCIPEDLRLYDPLTPSELALAKARLDAANPLDFS